MNLAEDVLKRLAELNQTVAVAESLTGGQLCAALVDVPGASAVFRGGLIVYATDLKHTLAGVANELLKERGPVDPEVALSLASGARLSCGADWGVATTGVAGPDPLGDAPVGTTFVACHGPLAYGAVRQLHLVGDRAQIRAAAVTAALELLHEHVVGSA